MLLGFRWYNIMEQLYQRSKESWHTNETELEFRATLHLFMHCVAFVSVCSVYHMVGVYVPWNVDPKRYPLYFQPFFVVCSLFCHFSLYIFYFSFPLSPYPSLFFHPFLYFSSPFPSFSPSFLLPHSLFSTCLSPSPTFPLSFVPLPFFLFPSLLPPPPSSLASFVSVNVSAQWPPWRVNGHTRD